MHLQWHNSKGETSETLLGDYCEVTDTANKEELSLSLRFVDDGTVKEVFVDFVEVERITGQVLAQTILQWHHHHTDFCIQGDGENISGFSDWSFLLSEQPRVEGYLSLHLASS